MRWTRLSSPQIRAKVKYGIDDLEIACIARKNIIANGYNETSGGLGEGQPMPSRLKMRAAKFGKPLTKEHGARIIDFSNIAAVCRGARKITRGMCFSYGVL